jgi:hypothetical protein
MMQSNNMSKHEVFSNGRSMDQHQRRHGDDDERKT